VRELTSADFKRMRPFTAQELEKLRDIKNATIKHVSDAECEASKRRGRQKAPTKERITIRLSPDVLSRFRASGTGWQGRVDTALREWLKRHSPGKGV
jgi:uncharacterized protein (DUF4415 family)